MLIERLTSYLNRYSKRYLILPSMDLTIDFSLFQLFSFKQKFYTVTGHYF